MMQPRGLDVDAVDRWMESDSEGELEMGSVKPSKAGVGKVSVPAEVKDISRRKSGDGGAKDVGGASFGGKRRNAGSKPAEGRRRSHVSSTGRRMTTRGRKDSTDGDTDDGDEKGEEQRSDNKDGGGSRLDGEDGDEGEEIDAPQPNDEDEGEEEDEEPEEDAQENDTDIPPDHIRCKIRFAPDEPVGSYKMSWSKLRHWDLLPTTRIDDLDKNIRERLVVLLKYDTQLLAKLHDKKALLCYGLHVQVPHCEETVYRPTESRHTFETIGDLFRDPSANSLELDVVVQLSYDNRPEDVQHQPKYKFNHSGKKNVPVEQLVLEGQEFKEDTDR